LVRADHPVDMDKTLVAALRCDLLGRAGPSHLAAN
jgi:hypothetical protein